MASSSVLRLAMWSGPRNISTACMRSFGNRPDTFVCDEPLYAHYLLKTGRVHPGREETLAHHESDWRKVVEWLTTAVEPGKAIFYQKHMTHHLLPEIERDWLGRLVNCFLIRDPREMLTSLLKHVPDAGLPDTGLPQQVEIFRAERARLGRAPPVIDARDVLTNPRGVLGALCDALGAPFYEQMLRWPPGPRATDGAWAKYWYKEVEQTTTFAPHQPKREQPPDELRAVYEQCAACYEELLPHRLRA